MSSKLEQYQPFAIALLRIIAGYLFIFHGTAKFFEFPMSMTGGHGAVPLMSTYGLAGLLELVGGALLILGLFSRFTAFILSGEMAGAYLMAHASTGHFFLPILNGGELAVLYSFVFLALIFTGPGAFALDNKLAQNK